MQEATFADVEGTLKFLMEQIELKINVANEAPIHKKQQAIIGDMSHRYLLVGARDAKVYRNKVIAVVGKLEATYPALNFHVYNWKPHGDDDDNDGVRGYYLRVGRIPPQVSLASEALSQIARHNFYWNQFVEGVVDFEQYLLLAQVPKK